MGCGSSTAAAVPAPAAQNVASSPQDETQQPRPYDPTTEMTGTHQLSSAVSMDPKPTGESRNVPGRADPHGSPYNVNNGISSAPNVVSTQHTGVPQDLKAVQGTDGPPAQAEQPKQPASQGYVVDRVTSIVSKDDDVFGQDSDVLADAEKVLGEMPAPDPIVSKQGGGSKRSQNAINPLSDSIDDSVGGFAPVKPQFSRQSSSSSNTRPHENFTDITQKGSSALPALNSTRQNQGWQAPAALDQLGQTEEVLVITPPAAERTEVTHFEHIAEGQDSEEEDGFDANAVSAPKFNELPAVRESAAYHTAEAVEEGVVGDPDDPWESLQSQYRIRADARSPPANATKPKSSTSQLRDSDKYELILDEDARVNPGRHVRKESGRGRTGTRQPALPPTGSGPKAANWGDGVMAQAGDIMLGRGALDEDYVPDPLAFGGNADSNFSAGYVEYHGNEQSFDLDGTYMEVPKPPDAYDIAMEDFTDDMIASAGQKPVSNVKPSLAEKLRQFEAQFDDDDYADEDLIREEMRLIASSKNL